MTDEEIVARIEWSVNVAPHAKGGPRWCIAANLPPLKDGDKPIGEAGHFRMAGARAVYVAAKTQRIQKNIVARYRLYNEQGGPVRTKVPRKALEQQLIEAAEFR